MSIFCVCVRSVSGYMVIVCVFEYTVYVCLFCVYVRGVRFCGGFSLVFRTEPAEITKKQELSARHDVKTKKRETEILYQQRVWSFHGKS